MKIDSPYWLRGVTPRHFLLNGNLLPFEVKTPVKSWREKEQNREKKSKSQQVKVQSLRLDFSSKAAKRQIRGSCCWRLNWHTWFQVLAENRSLKSKPLTEHFSLPCSFPFDFNPFRNFHYGFWIDLAVIVMSCNQCLCNRGIPAVRCQLLLCMICVLCPDLPSSLQRQPSRRSYPGWWRQW